MRTSGFSATTNSSNGGTTNRTDCYGLRTTLAKARKIMLLCGIVNELEKDSGVLSCFFCQASINSATAVLRGLIYILVDRQRLFSRIKQLFEDVNA